MTPSSNPNLRDFLYIAPEIFLAIWALVVLFVDLAGRQVSAPKRRVGLGLLTILGTLLALGLVYWDLPSLTGLAHSDSDPVLFWDTISGDLLTRQLDFVILVLLSLVVCLSMAWDFTSSWGEYYALLCWAAVGMMILVASEELLTLFLALETMTLCLYLLCAFEPGLRRSPEAALKYFVYGSVSSALFLFGLSLLYGLTGSTRLDAISRVLDPSGIAHPGLSGNLIGSVTLVLILVGFGFKLAAVPFHQWAPDVYQGAPAPVASWIATGSKLASIVALTKVLGHALESWARGADSVGSPGWVGLVAIVAALTMTLGNLAALAQRNYKRLLAYSSIAHAGYILVGVAAVGVRPNNDLAAGAVLFYTIVYAIATLGAFSLAAWMASRFGRDDVDDLNGLGLAFPALGVAITLVMLSLLGIPPLAGFFGKLYLFLEVLNSNEQGHIRLGWLVALALVNTVISAFYYVRILRALYLRQPASHRTTPIAAASAPRGVRLTLVLSSVALLVLGLTPAPLLDSLRAAALPMLSTSSSVGIAPDSNERIAPSTPTNSSYPASDNISR